MSSSLSSRPKVPQTVYHPTDSIVNRSNDAISKSIETIQKCLILDGNFIENIAMAAGVTTLIKHKLNRKIRGYIVCGLTSSTNIYRDQTSNADLIIFIPLISSAVTTINLWVF